MSDSKYNISGNTFNGPAQIGDSNELLIGKFSSFVDGRLRTSDTDEEAKRLFKQLQNEIVNAEDINKYTKVDVSNDLAQVVDEIQKPQDERDSERITFYWEKVINAVRDIGAIASLASTIAKLLNI